MATIKQEIKQVEKKKRMRIRSKCQKLGGRKLKKGKNKDRNLGQKERKIYRTKEKRKKGKRKEKNKAKIERTMKIKEI